MRADPCGPLHLMSGPKGLFRANRKLSSHQRRGMSSMDEDSPQDRPFAPLQHQAASVSIVIYGGGWAVGSALSSQEKTKV